MHERDVVIGDDAVPQRREALLHPLDDDRVREGVAEVLQLLIRGGVGDQQPSLVAWVVVVVGLLLLLLLLLVVVVVLLLLLLLLLLTLLMLCGEARRVLIGGCSTIYMEVRAWG